MPTNSGPNSSAVERYYDAWTRLGGDLGNVPLSEDFVFIGPTGTLTGRAEVQAMADQFGPVARNFRVREQHVAGDTVVSIVEWELPGVDGTTSAAEFLTMVDDEIARAELFYDPHLVLEFTESNS